MEQRERPSKLISFLRKRLGLNWQASFPHVEASICTRCKGITNIAPAGIVMLELRLTSALKEINISGEEVQQAKVEQIHIQ
ncbi:Os07g0644550 [Oryza sativa Japonica Group]|uniref:Os07g0644550 protein n=1 Tax=Oryza sativa subsp. japonica TaxID=39947 RepID=A0A0P0X9H8_ORYSJ|nr:hypothetical protein EE612_040984 [Oryza sativa]BAT02892.1 Os07g0644550 [Oryza sativa Japonica Group]